MNKVEFALRGGATFVIDSPFIGCTWLRPPRGLYLAPPPSWVVLSSAPLVSLGHNKPRWRPRPEDTNFRFK